MKKNLVKATFVAAIAMVCGVSFLKTQKSENLSEVAMANVEALAADDDSTEICVKLVNCECGEFTESPSGDSYRIWIDKVNRTF